MSVDTGDGRAAIREDALLRASGLGFAAGSFFGFLETFLAYAYGVVPRSHSLDFFAFDLTVWTSLGLLAGLLTRFASGRVPRWGVSVFLLVAPQAVFAVRALRGIRNPGWDASGAGLAAAVWMGDAALLGCVLLAGLRSRAAGGGDIAAPRFLALSALSQAAAAFSAAAVLVGESERRIAFAAHLLVPLDLWLAGTGYVLLVAVGSSWPRSANAQSASWRRPVLTCALVSLLAAAGSTWWLGEPVWHRSVRGYRPVRGLAPSTPSVLLITLDTVRRDHLSCYAYRRRTTPHLDAFAQHALLFRNAYAPAPYTLSSHASLLTGLPASVHGARPIPFGATPPGRAATSPAESGNPVEVRRQREHLPLLPGVPTLAESLQARGYCTGAIAANWAYLGEWTGLSRGFQHYDASRKSHFYGYPPLVVGLAHRWWPRLEEWLRLTPKPQGSDITDAATAWLARVGKSPFFLFLNYLDAHAPYDPPPPFDRRFAPEKPARSIDLNLAFEDIDRGARELRPDEREFLWARYDGEIAYQDTQVGRLLSWMDSKGLLDRTLVIITSDHGEFFGEHGLVFHLGPLYEPVLQIPLLVKPPGMGRGEEVSRRVTLGAVPSLIRRVLDGARTRRDLFGEQDSGDEPIEAEIWMPESYHRRNPARYSSRAMRAVYRGNLKLIQTDTAHAELFDLHRDPGEARNLFTEDPVAAARIAAEMTRSLPALRVEPTVSLPVPALSLDVLEQLRGLGYLH